MESAASELFLMRFHPLNLSLGNMVLECKAPANILLADTRNINGIAHGQMILQLPEEEQLANKMIHYLRERKLTVEELDDYVG